MTLIDAITLANRVIAELESAGIEPDRKEYGLIVQAYNELLESEETADLGHRLNDHFSLLIDTHDAKGNYIGAVANENGWTP